jgi:hypothetical protein
MKERNIITVTFEAYEKLGLELIFDTNTQVLKVQNNLSGINTNILIGSSLIMIDKRNVIGLEQIDVIKILQKRLKKKRIITFELPLPNSPQPCSNDDDVEALLSQLKPHLDSENHLAVVPPRPTIIDINNININNHNNNNNRLLDNIT